MNDSSNLLRRNLSEETKVEFSRLVGFTIWPIRIQCRNRKRAFCIEICMHWLLTYFLLDHGAGQTSLDELLGNQLQLGNQSVAFDGTRRDAKGGAVEHNLGQIDFHIVCHGEFYRFAIERIGHFLDGAFRANCRARKSEIAKL